MLKIKDMTVTWRHAIDLGAISLKDFERKHVLDRQLIDAGVAVTPDDVFSQLQTVSYRVCSLISHKALLIQLPSIEMASLDHAQDLSLDKIREQLDGLQWNPVRCMLLLHQSGVALIKYQARFLGEATAQEAIADVRLGLETLVLRGPAHYTAHEMSDRQQQWVRTVSDDGSSRVWAASLRDFSAHAMRDYLRAGVGPHLMRPFRDIRTTKLVSTTLIEVDRTEPRCDYPPEFFSVESHGRSMRGVGTMDRAYPTRSDALIVEAFNEDLSQDEEMCLYLLGLSDLVLYTVRADEALPEEQRRLDLPDQYVSARYIAGHYACLMEWLQIERYLIEMYDRLLSRSMTRDMLPEDVLELQRSSMQDLLEYGEGITPYPTRAAIRERARELARLPEEQARLEKKRDVVADYVMQKYSLRTNRGIQLLNMIVAAAIAFEVMQLAMQIADSSSPQVWTMITAIVFGLLLLGFVNSYRSLEMRR